MTDSVRIDKWLWAARFFKTRSLATDAVASGKVHINDDKTKASRNVKLGDRLWINNGTTEWEVIVDGLAEKRGSATIAQGLYTETQESIAKRQLEADRRKLFVEPSHTIKGRPTKRDRRLLEKTTT
jgi:ribosome-associated heat shock protein Hsp15